MNPAKPGLLTTEFWLTVLSIVLSVALASGTLTPGDVEHVQTPLTSMVKEALSLMVNGILIAQYMRMRGQAKSSAAELPPPGRWAARPGEDLLDK
jgi:hypothetical protein